MGSGHSHTGAPVTAAARHRWRLVAALVLVAAFFVVELVVGLLASSLALVSDAGHMAADVVTLTAALVATRVATRADHTGRRTYGSYRAEVFASGLAVLVMLGVAAYIVIEAVARIGHPVAPASGTMLAVGVLGLVVNLIAIVLLRAGAVDSLNLRGAYLEVLADTVGSVGVIAAAMLIAGTGSTVWDTVIALAIAAFVVVRAVMLGREVIAVLGQHAPAGIEPHDLVSALESLDRVHSVHDLHVWTLTSGMNVATAHLVMAVGGDSHRILDAAREVLRIQFGIDHATLQVEPLDHVGCDTITW